MTDLIKKLEALEAPCRECDYAIGKANGYDYEEELGGAIRKTGPAYTASIDAAMTLVPEGDYDQDWVRTTRAASEGFKLWQVRIALETTQQDPDETSPVALGEHDNPAIALCIAALRAQEASNAGR
jgi:hypothetical protein